MTKKVATTTSPADSKPAAITVIADLANTAWRVAVPVILLAGLGLLADKSWSTGPLFTLIGTALGLVTAGLLITKQLKNINGGL